MSVKVCPTLTAAVLYVAATLKNPRSAGWRIIGPGGTTISDTPGGWALLSPVDHD